MGDRLRDLAVYPCSYSLETRRSDSLGKGHIPNAVLANYADDARASLHVSIMDEGLFGAAGSPTLVLGETAMRFLEEVTFPGTLTIGLGIMRIGTSSMQECFAFFRDKRCLVLGTCTMVRVGADRRPEPFTEAERRRADAVLLRNS